MGQAVNPPTPASATVAEAVHQALQNKDSFTFSLAPALGRLSDAALWEGLTFTDARTGLTFYVRLYALQSLLIRHGIHVKTPMRPDYIPLTYAQVKETNNQWHLSPAQRQTLFHTLSDPALPASHHLFFVAALAADSQAWRELKGHAGADSWRIAESLLWLGKTQNQDEKNTDALWSWADTTVWTTYLRERDHLDRTSDHVRFLSDTFSMWKDRLLTSLTAEVQSSTLHPLDLWILSQGLEDPAPILRLLTQADTRIAIPAQRALLWMATRQSGIESHLKPADLIKPARSFLHASTTEDQKLALRTIRGWIHPVDASWLPDLLPLTQSGDAKVRGLAIGCLPVDEKRPLVFERLRSALADSDVDIVGWALTPFSQVENPPAWSGELLKPFLKSATPQRLESLRWRTAYVQAGRLLENLDHHYWGFNPPENSAKKDGTALMEAGQRNSVTAFDQLMIQGLSVDEAVSRLQPVELMPLPPNGAEALTPEQVSRAIAKL